MGILHVNNIHWKFKIIVRAIIINDSDEILLVQRAKDPDKEKWSLVGGKVEILEKAEEAIIREIKEELHVTFYPQFLFYLDDFTSVPKDHCLVLVFSGKIKGKIKIKKDEILDIKYWNQKEVNDNKNLVAFNHWEVLSKYYEKR